jgi:Zn-dependent peptidase ImmA (M78 family)
MNALSCRCAAALPQALGLSRGDVTAIAEQVRRKLNYQPGQRLDAAVAALGGKVVFGEDEALLFELTSEHEFTIGISRNTGLRHDRFMTAQALGHYILHVLYARQHQQRRVDALHVPRYATDQSMVEALWFAAAFLMPASEFRAQHQAHQGNVFVLAESFQVTPRAAHHRTVSLGLAVPDHATA